MQNKTQQQQVASRDKRRFRNRGTGAKAIIAQSSAAMASQGPAAQRPTHPPTRGSTPSTTAPLTAANLARHQRQFRELRQFGCATCCRTWWKMASSPKFTSRCGHCRVRYDAVPVEEQHGWGIFECECGHTWSNGKAKGNLEQDCKRCGKLVSVKKIGPPPRRPGARRSQNRHSCVGCATGACRFQFVASRPHVSTGSTISTSASVATLASVEDSASIADVNAALKRLSLGHGEDEEDHDSLTE